MDACRGKPQASAPGRSKQRGNRVPVKYQRKGISNYAEGKRDKTFDQALQIVAEERGWIDRRVAENRKPSLPKLKFMERTPPELYDGYDWMKRVNEWRIAHKLLPLEPSR
jgi:hypothetical protein